MQKGKDILSEYGRDIDHPQAARATSGGVKSAKPLSYKEPQGPIGIGNKSVGLGGDNHGCGTSGSSEHMTGKPGLGGTTSSCGSQR